MVVCSTVRKIPGYNINKYLAFYGGGDGEGGVGGLGMVTKLHTIPVVVPVVLSSSIRQ